jgi:myo-inositol-1(or 4)-monophosphatase
MAIRSATINVMVKAAHKAARGLVRDFGEVEQLQVSQKGPADFVSTADLQAERTLRQELKRARPEFGLLMEEGTNEPSTDGRHRWIVDPLDGTLNFLHGLPHFAISIGLERDGEIVAGVVYDPIKDELFWAERGVGCYLNDRRLRVSARRDLGQAVIATGTPHVGRPDHQPYLDMLAAVMAQTAGIRRFGAAALDLAYVAAGRYDGYFEVGLSPWDIAAGILLVREAGGYVSEIAGGHHMLQSGSVLAGNDHLHLPLGSLLRGVSQVKRAAV